MSQSVAKIKVTEEDLQKSFNDIMMTLQDFVEDYVGVNVMIRYNFQMGIHPTDNSPEYVSRLNQVNSIIQEKMQSGIDNYRKLRVLRGDVANAWEAKDKELNQQYKPKSAGPEVTLPQDSDGDK